MYIFQTHFDFTNLGSKLFGSQKRAISFGEIWSWTPCSSNWGQRRSVLELGGSIWSQSSSNYGHKASCGLKVYLTRVKVGQSRSNWGQTGHKVSKRRSNWCQSWSIWSQFRSKARSISYCGQSRSNWGQKGSVYLTLKWFTLG